MGGPASVGREEQGLPHRGGFDFLGWRIQRRAWRSRTGKTAIYTYPSKKAPASIVAKVRTLTRRAAHRTLADLLRRLNAALRGWCTYFRHGVSARTFSRHGVSARTFGYLDHYAFWRIVGWLRKRHPRLNLHIVVRRYLPNWKISADGIEFFRAETVTITHYRYRGTRIPTHGRAQHQQRHEHAESRMLGNGARPVGRRAAETDQSKTGTALRPDPTPNTPPGKERSTAPRSWTSTAGSWWLVAC